MLALLLMAAVSSHAQQVTANPARITQVVDGAALTTLKGNVHPLARPQYDKGPANPSLPADRMQLVLQRSPGQEIALRQLLGSLQDPNSPQYRKWLTPEQLGAQYGVSDADIQTVSTWLASQGFKVNKVNKAHTVIEFSGSVGQLQSAFHTQIHNFTVNGVQHIANFSDPQVPTALTPVVVGLSSMNNFFPKPPHHHLAPGKYDRATDKMSPALTVGSASEGYLLAVGPGDAATIYDTPNALNTKFTGSASYTGSGVAIGIIGGSDIAPVDIANYRSLFGLPAAAPTVIIDGNDPGADNGDGELEATLDLEVSGGLAPGASQYFYIGADTLLDAGFSLAIDRALDDNMVSILSLSLGYCELFNGESGNEYFYDEWEQAAAQGITVTVSAGDAGSAGCDDFDTAAQAQYGLQVNGFGSTPFNIAVGGTDYDVLSTNFTQYASTTNGKNFTSALGYIPEKPWNNSTNVNGLLSANTPVLDATTGEGNIVAGSGGMSGCVNPLVNSDGSYMCLANPIAGTETGWPKPSWQSGSSLNIPADNVRDLPDLSLLAGDGFYDAGWLICTSLVGGADCVQTAQGFGFIPVGGTSASAPAFAGMLALISQSQGGSAGPARLGQANYVLYNLANQGSLYGSLFHDVTEGNNSVYCVSGSLDCGSNLFETGYNTGPDYDLASGLGSVDVTQLVDDWNKATFTSTTTALTINGGTAPVSITHGQTVNLDATVAGAGGTPSGDVALISNANQQANTYGANGFGFVTLTGGTTGPVSFNGLPGGTYSVSANYGGDITFTQSVSNAIQVTVAKEDSVLNLFGENGSGSAITISGSYPYGTYFSLDAQPVGASQAGFATGTVTFTDTAGALPGSSASSAPGVVALNSNGYAELPVYYWSTAAHSVSASYGGDNSFNASTATPVSFTITPAPTSSTVTSSVSSVSGGTFTVTSLITPSPASGATAPSGTVTLTANGNTIGCCGAVTAITSSTTGAVLATVTITVNASSLAAGANTITASYSGDTNYAASTGTVVVTSTSTNAPAIAISASSLAPIVAGGSETITVSVTPSGGFTGAVNLTCSVMSPSGASSPPTCSYNPASVTISGTTAATSSLTIATTSTTTAGSYAVGISAADAATGKITNSGSLLLTVNAAGAPASVALTPAPTAVTISSPGQSGTSTVSVTPTGYTGTLNLTCALATAPSGANSTYNPTCTLPATLAISAAGVATTNASFATTAPTSGALAYPETNRRSTHWYTAAGGAALACILFFGIPARRRGWKSMLSLLVFLVAMAGVGCGGGSSGGGGNSGTPGTTVGSYTFTVTATDSKTATITATGTVNVTVN